MEQLIIRVLQGEASPAEREQLEAWRRTSHANERRFRHIADVWGATGVDFDAFETVRPTAVEILERAEEARHPRRRSWSPHFRRVAAVAAAILFGLLIGEFRTSDQEPMAPALHAAEFITGPAQLATARLSDGTVVRLAPSSRLRVSEDADRRVVWLNGKAFFAVAPNHRVPFVVRTRAGEALVLGTRFEADITTADLRILVVEGRVELDAAEHRVQIGAGQQSRTSNGAPIAVSNVEDIESTLDWMGKFLAFENTPLHQVAREFEHRYELRIEIADTTLARRTITAWFGDEDPEDALRVICRIADAHCSIRDGVATIEP